MQSAVVSALRRINRKGKGEVLIGGRILADSGSTEGAAL
jgi:hypothetical protein